MTIPRDLSNLAPGANTSGVLQPAKGGTGLTSPGTNGNVLTSNGTAWVSAVAAAGGISYTAVQTANYTAANNQGVQTNTTAGSFTVTLPTTPTVGDIVIVIDALGTWGTNNLTVGRAGENIAGLAENLICDINGASVTLVYTGATYGWNVAAQVGGNGGTVMTLDGIQTVTGTKTFAGTSSTLAMILSDTAEVATVSATAATGTINFDITTQSVIYYTSDASANWTLNFRASSGTSLNAAMAVGQSVTAAFLVTNGATAYYNNVVQVDGTTITPKFQGGTAYTAGNSNSIDVYMYTIIKTASATFTVLASQTKFA